MADPTHPHDHDDHDACCGPAPRGEHDPSHGPDQLTDLDQASQSLADALRVSFRLLTLIMILVVLAFLMTGLKTISPNQVGIKKVFGRQTAEVLTPGLAYNWPYPIGEIELVDTREQSLAVNDFWMYESESDKLVDELSKRSPASPGLRPGWDGVLLTGDRNMVHMKLACTYSIRQAAKARAAVPEVADAVRTAVDNAAVRAAAQWSADGILKQGDQFGTAVLSLAQKELDALMGLGKDSAVVISKVQVPTSSWPLHVLAAVDNVQNARTNQEKAKQQARADALNTLNSLMDRKYVDRLAGDILGEKRAARGTAAQGGEKPLIERYDDAIRQGDRALAAKLLEEVDAVLTQPDVGGQVSTIISQANSQASETVQKVNARAERFNRLLADYKANPEFMLQRLWAATREEILSNPSAEKLYLTLGAERMVITISRDPQIIKSISEGLLKQQTPAGGGK